MNRRIARKISGYVATGRRVKVGLIVSAGAALSGWANCFFKRRCEVITENGERMGGVIICDPPKSATIILRDNGILQIGGTYRPV